MSDYNYHIITKTTHSKAEFYQASFTYIDK